jgi:hypothetical protein
MTPLLYNTTVVVVGVIIVVGVVLFGVFIVWLVSMI